MIKIWGRTSSSNVMKVLWCCAELGEPFERIDWGGKYGGNEDPAYLALNPNGLVPTVQDGKLVIWESHTIMRYLCTTRAAERLYPTDPRKRTFVERWMDWQNAHGGGPLVTLFFGHIREPGSRSPAELETARKEGIAVWKIVEHGLELSGDYLAGSEFTIADIPVGILARRWFGMPIERPSLPRLQAWYDRLSVRPGFVEHIGGPLA
jgi:glutathione S-transferase